MPPKCNSKVFSSPTVCRNASGTRLPTRRYRVPKRPGQKLEATSSQANTRRSERVWMACERCRMKKSKCDGVFPCQRCNENGFICTAGRRRTVYKELPKGYGETLENTQFILVATIRKLYRMVRNGEQWDLGEPKVNNRGQEVVHNIAEMLACIPSGGEVDVPAQWAFPEYEADMDNLARRLEEQQTALEMEIHEEELKDTECSHNHDLLSNCSSFSPEEHHIPESEHCTDSLNESPEESLNSQLSSSQNGQELESPSCLLPSQDEGLSICPLLSSPGPSLPLELSDHAANAEGLTTVNDDLELFLVDNFWDLAYINPNLSAYYGHNQPVKLVNPYF